MTPTEGRRLFYEAELPKEIVDYDHELHGEEMRYLATGLIGALISISEIESLSGPELGSRIPLVVLAVKGDWLRMYVDPKVDVQGEHRVVSALSWAGDKMKLITKDLPYAPWRRIVEEVDRQQELLDICR